MVAYNALNILMILFSVQITRIYARAVFSHPSRISARGVFAWLGYILFQLYVICSRSSVPILTILLSCGFLFLVFVYAYSASYLKAILYVVLFQIFALAIEVILGIFLSLGMYKGELFFLMGNVISKMLLFIIVNVFSHFWGKNRLFLNDTGFPTRYWIWLLLLPITTIVVIHIFYLLIQPEEHVVILVTVIVLLLLTNCITFDVYDKSSKRFYAEKLAAIYEQQLDICIKQASERESVYQETRRMKHDLKNYLIDLKTTLQADDVTSAIAKVDGLMERGIDNHAEIANSRNLVIDSLINYKYSLAQTYSITMNCRLSLPNTLPFDSADLCIIVGNLLDNAIEGTRCLPQSDRVIDVLMEVTKGMNLFIEISNPYEGEIRRDTLGKIITSKHDALNHGVGLFSVENSVNHYDGTMMISTEGQMFSVRIILPVP